MLISVDAQGLEWRVLVWLANDPVAIQELNNGLDVHAINQKAFNLPSRLISKIYLFRTIYRGSGWAFANDPDFMHVSKDPDYWDNINTLFYNKYRGIDKCHRMWSNLVSQNKPIVSPLGREWLIPLKNGQIHWPTMTNWPVQGTGNDLISIARVSLKRRLPALVKMILTIHDSIVCDCPEDFVADTAGTMIEVFNDIPRNLTKLFGINPPIAFPGEVKVGKNLKEMEKLILK
jgi:DNA polymerase I-like protein with 3'-5' exonuclease and polymerase domains